MWKEIPGFEGLYEASTDGQIRSVDRISPHGHHLRGKVLKQRNHTQGYLSVSLSKDGVVHEVLVHRAIAIIFIPNPESHGFVNHKDEDKRNNAVENLEWCTKQYNNTYNGKMEKQLPYTQKPVIQVDLEGNEIARFDSAAHAARVLGFDKSGINHCCRGTAKTHHGFMWKYAGREVS